MDKLNLNVTYQSLIRVAVVVAAISVLNQLLPLLSFLMLAVLVGVCLAEIVARLKKYHFPTWLSHTVVILLTGGFLYFLFGVLVPSIVNQVTAFAGHLPEYRKSLEDSIESPGLKNYVHTNFDKLPEQLGSISERIMSLGGVTVNALYQFGVLIILSLYLMVDGKRAYLTLLSKIKQYAARGIDQSFEKTAIEIKEVIFAYAFGQTLTCAFVAIYTYAVNRILHVPGALTLAAIATLADIIPVVGFISSLIVGVLVAYAVSPLTALELGIFYILYSLIENYFIVPRIYGSAMKLSRLTVLLAILIGGKLGGILGMILTLPIAGSWHAIEKYWIQPRVRRGQNTELLS